VEREVHALEQQTQKARARRAQLESFRRRPETDLYMVTEISRRLPASAWVNHLQINDDGVQLTGQADVAAPLLSLLDSSGVVTGASFMSSISRADNREQFRIHASRRAAPAGPEQASATPPPPAAGHGADAPAAPGHNQAPAALPPGHSQGAPPPAGAHSPAHSSN
jgi:Tfp pilus assembly protein PilN